MVLTYPDGTEWTSETFNVTVEEGTPPIYIDSIEIYGLGDLYVGEVPPTVDDLWSNDSRYTINSITWGGLSKGTTGVLTSNSYFQISLSAGYTGSSNGNPYYYFHWDENGNLPFTIHGNNRTLSSYHYNPGQNLVRSVTLSYYFDNHTYLQSSLDTVELEQSVFSLRPGQNVNISLKPTLNCPEKHEVKHSISSVRLDSTTPLPAGLSMDSQGHITGTLTEEVKDDPITVVVYYDGNLYDTTNSVLKFYITDQPDEIKKSIDPNMFKNLDHVHTFGEYSVNDSETHSRFCSDCGSEEQSPHNWSDKVTIIEKATPGHDGAMLLSCTDCYAQKVVTYTYEDEGETPEPSGKLGDADNDGEVTIIDATAIQRTIAGLDQYPFVEQQADVDNDHSVTVVDATYIQRYLAGLSHPIGIGAFG